MSTCPYSDENCSSCPRCVGSQFIPTTGMPPCTCEGTGCDNAEHREFCVHGYEKGNCVDCALTDWSDNADAIAKEARDVFDRQEARNAHR